MPSWHQILNEITVSGSTQDIIRRKYLKKLYRKTKRNIIIYYSGWLQKPGLGGTEVSDSDKNGFMTVIHKLDRKKGLDLILHTPGGETAATESLVDYLRAMFDVDIRVFIPQLALSAGTMIACATKEIFMGKESSMGPIDPQFKGIPAHGVLEEFKKAYEEVRTGEGRIDQAKLGLWQPIVAKYPPAFIGECEKAIQWSKEMVIEWLCTGMLKEETEKEEKAKKIFNELGDHALTKSHARHLSFKKCKDIGLKVTALEDDQTLQDMVLSVHHSCILTLSSTPAYKIIENHNGVAFIQIAQNIMIKK